MRIPWRLSLLVIALCAPQTATAELAVCDEAARRASELTGVPLPLLLAVTRVETGRGTPSAPWPWTVNSAGKGYWFATQRQAQDFATNQIAAGQTSLDIGCFQMNHRWHRDRFTSLTAMFDPAQNALQAARFLLELRQSEGGWTAAAAAYHSRDDKRGATYLRKIATFTGTAEAPVNPDISEPVRLAAHNTTPSPLFIGGKIGSPGSLVPLGGGLIPLVTMDQ